MTKNINGWFSKLLNYGTRAAGAIISDYVGGNDDNIIGTIGPINITEIDGEKYGENTADFSVSLNFSSTNNTGSPEQKEKIFNPEEKDVKIGELLDGNLTGNVSWRKFDNNGEFTVSENGEKPGGLMTAVKDWAKKPLTLANNDLTIIIDKENNRFNVRSLNYSYSDIRIIVVAIDGSVYNFGPFSMKDAEDKPIDYPAEMDRIIPIPMITFMANVDESCYNMLLKK